MAPNTSKETKNQEPKEDTINLKSAAFEVYKETKRTKLTCLLGIGGMFVVMILTMYSMMVGTVGTFAMACVLIFFTFTAHKKMMHLQKTYGLESSMV